MADREHPERMPVVYAPPNMDAVAIHRDVPYRHLDGKDTLADIYRPAGIGTGTLLPAAIFVHGDGPPGLGQPKEWGQYQGWGRLAAGGLEIEEVPGDHISVLEEPHVRSLAERLRVCLEKAQVEAGERIP